MSFTDLFYGSVGCVYETGSNLPTQQAISDATSRLRGKPKAWDAGLKDEKAQKLLDERYQEKVREATGKQNMMNAINNPNRGTFIQDERGLNEAYKKSNDGEGTWYDSDTRTLNIRGS